MNVLVVYAHPNEGSFNEAILKTAVSALESKGHEVVVRDLYKLGFNPVLSSEDLAALHGGNVPSDIAAEQEFIKKADLITFIYPIWWTGLPAIIKGYVDRAFSYGFAYQYNESGGIDKLLGGKKGVIINTHGSPKEYYDGVGMTNSLKQTSSTGIYEFVGIEVAEQLIFGGINGYTDQAVLKQYLSEVSDKLTSL
ncbi:NAD(P)H dehydrogenase [Paenibacillus oryzae]|uniref:NAD(P)H dehydrogenase n=1 Tax=Paenibacillus oryzae TaxID=1844972 RepID=A0A1A5YHH8_9BACL|nr:NAD(P)H-dependent oxidoreductase [Paenibacillus oryzae]OBR65047.1 NAD(P)H dehydrogenase [Paenibacillus oryzae]